MKTIFKWAERVYAETDFGRSVATSVSGVIGLAVYLISADWVIAAFSTIFSFPIIRLTTDRLHKAATRRAKCRLERREAEDIYEKLSDDEKEVVRAFVRAGGCVLTWSAVNNLSLPHPAVESLQRRGVLTTSVTLDGMRETFDLDPGLFDVARDRNQTHDLPF